MRKPNVVHIMADGSRVKSIEGKIVPEDNPVYKILIGSSLKPEEEVGEWKKEAV